MANDELTPEEKLLQVIQNGDGAKASGRSAAAHSGADEPVTVIADSPEIASEPVYETPVASPAAGSGNLKLASKSERSSPDDATAVPVRAAAAASGGDMILSDEDYVADDVSDGDGATDAPDEEEQSVAVAATATPVAKKKAGDTDGVRRVNRLLLAAVLLILVLIGVEIWANISARPLPSPEPHDMQLPEAVETTLPPYERVLGNFEEKDWFHVPEKQSGEEDTPKPDQNAVAAFLQQNVKLVGLSRLPDGTPEALIADLIPDKMHFVKASDRLALGSSESPKLFTLKSIERDHVVLSDGTDEYTLK